MAKKKDKEEHSAESAANVCREMLAISRALADPRRVEVLRRIAGQADATCMDLRECLAVNPATLSHHMKQLESAGLIVTRRDGKFVRSTLRRKVWKSYLSYLKELGGV